MNIVLIHLFHKGESDITYGETLVELESSFNSNIWWRFLTYKLRQDILT